MIEPCQDHHRPRTSSPQLTGRASALGGFAVSLCAIISFSVWFVQILSGQRYIAAVELEEGGFGSVEAAAVARELRSWWFFARKRKYIPGNSSTV